MFVISIALASIYPFLSYGAKFYTVQEQKIFFAMTDRLGFRCGMIFRALHPYAHFCELASGNGKRVMLSGDSRMDAIKLPFIELARQYDASLFLSVKNCIPDFSNCSPEMFVEEAKKIGITDFVFHGIVTEPKAFEPLDELITKLKAEKIRLHIIDPTPAFPESVPEALYEGRDSKTSRQEYHKINAVYFAWKKKHKDVHFYETESIFCPQKCIYANEGAILYFDSHHLTISGARLLAPIVAKIYN